MGTPKGSWHPPWVKDVCKRKQKQKSNARKRFRQRYCGTPSKGHGTVLRKKNESNARKTIRQRYCGHLKGSRHPSWVEDAQKNKSNARKRSGDNENAICGHLYSPLLRKWTSWDHRGQVSYCMRGAERDLRDACRFRWVVFVGFLVGSPLLNLGLKGGLGFGCLFGKPFASDGQ